MNSVDQLVYTGHGSPERESDLILSLVASGLVRMQGWRGDVDRRRPYDARLQLGLDRLSVACARVGVMAPVGVGDLVWDWCAGRPLRDWPLVLDRDVLAGGELLLLGGRPSEFCREWVLSASDVISEVHESSLVNHVKDVARVLGRPELYAQWRRTVTRHSVVHTARMLSLKNAFLDVAPWAQWLDESYEPVPVSGSVAGQVAVCAGCGQWMTPLASGEWRCPSWRCAVASRLGEPTMTPADGLYRLRVELVTSVALPGAHELALAEALAARGAHVVLSPQFDALDVWARWPDGYAIGVDVKDWRNAYLLARRIKMFPAWSVGHPYAYESGFVAVAADRTGGRDTYLRILRARSAALRSQRNVHAVTDRELIESCPDTGVAGEVTCGP
ncbi:hypothetical protein [Kitasatospora sp. NPDC057015]|uniref:pPIWI_RE_Y domain-containing protein n=1 Tax=Kitasatospora sp. NPDC057015 TaxID=3346001 RepID=UPI003641AFA2